MDDDLLWRLLNDDQYLSKSDCAPLELFLRGAPQIAYDRILMVVTARGKLSPDRLCRILDNGERVNMGADSNDWARRIYGKFERMLERVQLQPASTVQKTELLTKKQISALWGVGKNGANAIIEKYSPEEIGGKYRFPVTVMPPKYHSKEKK